MEEYDNCIYSFERRIYAEYHVMRNNALAAYRIIEDGLKERSRKSKGRREVLLQDSKILFNKYPAILHAAKASFTNAAFDEVYEKFGDSTKDIERKRLAIYKKLADPGDYAEAVMILSAYFNSPMQY